MAVGLALGGWLVARVAPAMVSDMPRIEVPGDALVEFPEAGRFTIFDDRPAGAPPVLPRVGLAGDLSISASSEGTGADSSIALLPGSIDYAIAGRSGDGIGVLVIPEPGTYRVETSLAGDRPGGTIAIDAAGTMGTRFFGTFATGLLLLLASIPVGVVAILVVVLLRYRARRRPPAGPPNPQQSPPPPPPAAVPPMAPPPPTAPPAALDPAWPPPAAPPA